MNVIQFFFGEILNFFQLDKVLHTLVTGQYSELLKSEGIVALVYPFVPVLLAVEFFVGCFRKAPILKAYQLGFFVYIFNRFLGRYLGLSVVVFLYTNFGHYSILQTELTWYWFVYGYVVWEFSHFVYHYSCHKVRMLWCLHSTHHSAEHMNLSVNYTHFILEAPYADAIRGGICLIAGLRPEMLFLIMVVDGAYGGFIHIGENLIKDGRIGLNKLGLLGKIFLSPSDHRVHHARNPLYIDKNFCNLLGLWDRLFKTYQSEDTKVPIDYGISRRPRGKFFDPYFGEFASLYKDMASTNSISDKLRYLFMPPGWSPAAHNKTEALA
jgi:sterol desaturase/sphingolipid hydroxylase (fatty acid hydroxylase superfamily)